MDEIQILLAITVLYFTYRWWSGPSTPATGGGLPSSSSSSSNAATSAAQRFVALSERIPSDAVAQARAMFPQLSDREIRWEFVRTGRLRPLETVVQALLEERQTPIVGFFRLISCSHCLLSESAAPSQIPAGFLEPVPPPAAPAAPGTTRQQAASSLQKSRHESLIERLGLQKQVEAQDRELTGSSEASSAGDKGKGTERSLNESWAALTMQERKERMVLDARRCVLACASSLRCVVRRLLTCLTCLTPLPVATLRRILEKDRARG